MERNEASERKDEGDHGEAAAEARRSRLLRGASRVEEERQPVERAEDDAQAVHAVCLRFSMWAWPSARSRPQDPPGDERVEDPRHHVDGVVLAGVDDRERDAQRLQRLRAEEPVREAVLADDE